MNNTEIQQLKEWIICEGLKEFKLQNILTGLCERLSEHFNLYRVNLGMSTLHPLVAASVLVWHKEKGLEHSDSEHGYEQQDQWRNSPINYMFENKLDHLSYRLDQPGDWQRFPLLLELAELECTEYYAKMISFKDDQFPRYDDTDGIMLSWTTKAKGGFDENFHCVLDAILPSLGIVAKLAVRENTALNILETYLGTDAGERVLKGQIERGELVTIEAVIWYSDMRNSTSLAERLSNQEFLDTLNTYFECTAGSILRCRGEVLRFIGDAVLGIFPIDAFADDQQAARAAWQAANRARKQINELNLIRKQAGQQMLDFGLGLHAGSLDYGNIGVPQRLEFSVIGPVANEVARLESLTKELQQSIIVSDTFANLLDIDWNCLGPQKLKGVKNESLVYAPKTVSDSSSTVT